MYSYFLVMRDRGTVYAFLPVERRTARERELMTYDEAIETWPNVVMDDYRWVRVSRYPCDQDKDGEDLFPIVEILEAR